MSVCREKALWTNDPVAVKIGPGGYGSYTSTIAAAATGADTAMALVSGANQSGMALLALGSTIVVISSSGRYRIAAGLRFEQGSADGEYQFLVFPRVTTLNGAVVTEPITAVKGAMHIENIAAEDNGGASDLCEHYADLEVGDHVELIYNLTTSVGTANITGKLLLSHA